MQFYELCFTNAALCSKVATPCVMTIERSQNKRSCQGRFKWEEMSHKEQIKSHFASTASYLRDLSAL